MQGDRTTLRFGLIPRGDDDGAPERAFVAAAAEALGRDVEVHRAADYRVVLTGLEQRLVDFAWLPPLVGGRALRASLIDPAAIVMRYGDTEYRTALVTRTDSRIRDLKDLRGVRVAWVDRESASGYVVLRAALVRAGVQLTDAFSHEVFLRSHAAVARAVLQGDVDVGATCGHSDQEGVRFARSPFAGDGGISDADLRALFTAGPIPSDLFAVRRDVTPGVRLGIERALLQGLPPRMLAAARALVHADGFEIPTPEHRRMLEALVYP
jgi:phosphonate transport system substrate-binding protein